MALEPYGPFFRSIQMISAIDEPPQIKLTKDGNVLLREMVHIVIPTEVSGVALTTP